MRAPPRPPPHPSASRSSDFILPLGVSDSAERPPGEASEGLQGAGARGGGGRAPQLPAPAPRPRRRDGWTPATRTKDARICTPFTLQKEADKADAGAGGASRLREGAIVALKIQGRISHVSRRGIVLGFFCFFGCFFFLGWLFFNITLSPDSKKTLQ